MRKLTTCSNLLLSICNFFIILLFWIILNFIIYTKNTFGDVSFPQLFFFIIYGGTEGVEHNLIRDIICCLIIIPIVLTVAIFFALKKTYNGKNLFCNQYILLLYFLFLLLFTYAVLCRFSLFQTSDLLLLSEMLFIMYLLNLWRNYSPTNTFFASVIALFLLCFNVNFINCENMFSAIFELKTTNFYEQNYQYVGNIAIKKDAKRNVIIVFAESFENKYSSIENNNMYRRGGVKINDKNAVKFSNLTEGYSQNWTQGALFSAFSGTHIHYLSDIFRYKIKGFKFHTGERILMASNHLGENFKFQTPNITYLGDIAKFNNYNTLFVQGGNIKFSGTDSFLTMHGFDKNNIYDLQSFAGMKEYEKAYGWWGVPDRLVFEKFKEKITLIDKRKPFLAVMFTLDLHRGENPFFPKEEDQAKETINNFNNFISWFENQPFYKNTTLIIVGDHRRMGQKSLIGGGIYNAFFNLPQNLKKNLNVNRTFNQIDMFPTILNIMGAELQNGKAGVGASLFSNTETIAEKYSYAEQTSIFSKFDKFYQKLFEEKI